MGGIGSGNWGRRGRSKTSDMYAIDIRFLSRQGLLLHKGKTRVMWNMNNYVIGQMYVTGGDGKFVSFSYRYREDGINWIDTENHIQLSWTKCNFSGKRAWFICPACARRVAFLYGGWHFLCRYCQDLAYGSESESVADRAARKAEKIRARLGWKAGIFNPWGPKPKGMHQLTFMKLQVKYLNYVDAALDAIKQELRLY